MPNLESAVIALIFTSTLHAQLANAPSVGPKALRPPPSQALLVKLQGKGSQIYVCQNSADGAAPAWKLKAPDAKQSGAPVGCHFAGPTCKPGSPRRMVAEEIITSLSGNAFKDHAELHETGVCSTNSAGRWCQLKFVTFTSTCSGGLAGKWYARRPLLPARSHPRRAVSFSEKCRA